MRCLQVGLICVVVLNWTDGSPKFVAAQEVDFNRDIRTLLSDRCFVCHGPDEQANESGLRLDIASEAYDWEAFVPGDVENSSAIERLVIDNDSLKMPPPESNLHLSEAEIELLKRWVEQGAKYDQHWAFKPIPSSDSIAVPEMNEEWIHNEIDRFVLAKLIEHNLRPSSESERWRWLRRVTLDLTGLPPTPTEIAEFASDQSEQAYDRVVERLLDSPRFGEHFAVSWLDAARYGDSFGYQADLISPTWPYRDWLVQQLNNNLPYDQFLTWQLAGDLLPNATREQKLATAFNRLHRQTNEGGSVALEWLTEYAADRVHTFGTAMMGLTLECARCHDHKYDPISQREYYSLFAYFNNIDEWGMYHDSARVPTPSLLLPSEDQTRAIDTIQKELDRVRQELQSEFETFQRDRLPKLVEGLEVTQFQSTAIAHWTLDEIGEGRQLANSTPAGKPGTNSPANSIVPGKFGNSIQLTGDDSAQFPVDGFTLNPWERYAISLWMWAPTDLKEGVILHRQGGTDVGTFGTRLYLDGDHLLYSKVRFWPGNALAVKSRVPLERDRWNHVVISNDGSGTAEGMSIAVNSDVRTEVLRNNLTKNPQVGGNGFVVGEQFRTPGLKNAKVDEIHFYNRPLSRFEIMMLENEEFSIDFSDLDPAMVARHFWLRDEAQTQLKQQQSGLVQKLLNARLGIQETMVMAEFPDVKPAYVLHRGEYDAVRTESNRVTRGTPEALPQLNENYPANRLGLAKWLTDDTHPLASRVAVNRIWQQFFGQGLVGTPDDFGLQGTMPVHSELLDWLARDFMDHGWDVKRLCRQIVLSSTYRQSSRCEPELRELDPQNELFGRGPSHRLTAEMIRDTALFTSGLLNEKMGGPPVSPYQPPNLWRENNTMTPAYNQSVGVDLYRRSLYSVWKRTTPLPNMMMFDANSREVCTVQRSKTNTPLQAMVLLNDVQFVEAARALASRTIADQPDQVAMQIESMFIRLASRHPDEIELEILNSIYAEQLELFEQDHEAATKLLQVGETKTPTDHPTRLAALTIVAQAILSSDAAVWKR